MSFLVAVGFRGTSGESWGIVCIPFDFLHSAAVPASFTMLFLGSTRFPLCFQLCGADPELEGERGRSGEARIPDGLLSFGG